MKKVIQTIMDMVCKTNGLMSKFCRILLLVIVSGKMAHNGEALLSGLEIELLNFKIYSDVQ